MIMDFYEILKARHTIRDFQNIEIDDKIIEKIIGAGMTAPSNDHMRDWHFIVIKDKNIIRKVIEKFPKGISNEELEALFKNWNLQDECQQGCYRDAVPKQYRMFNDASCMIIPLLKEKTDILHPENISQLNGFASIWCCIENMLLAATAEGYAFSLRIPLGDESEWARSVLHFPQDYFLPCFLGLGKPAENANHVKQKEYSLQEHIHKNKW